MKYAPVESLDLQDMSLRSSERGLKSWIMTLLERLSQVAPFVGAWIEIFTHLDKDIDYFGRSVRRSVD